MERVDLQDRFSAAERRARDRVWEVLCREFFQRYVRPTDTTLDLGCGFGEFSRFIQARRRIAVDLNPEAAGWLPPEVEFHEADARCLGFLPPASVDVCFTSNFFEHLPSKADLDAVLQAVRGLLRPGGLLVALQPNIRYASGRYWDFYDHHIPLSHLSCAEAFRLNGLEVVELLGRFLPFTTCSVVPKHPFFVSLYLKLPAAWRLFGRQFLIVGRRGDEPDRVEPSG